MNTRIPWILEPSILEYSAEYSGGTTPLKWSCSLNTHRLDPASLYCLVTLRIRVVFNKAFRLEKNTFKSSTVSRRKKCPIMGAEWLPRHLQWCVAASSADTSGPGTLWQQLLPLASPVTLPCVALPVALPCVASPSATLRYSNLGVHSLLMYQTCYKCNSSSSPSKHALSEISADHWSLSAFPGGL